MQLVKLSTALLGMVASFTLLASPAFAVENSMGELIFATTGMLVISFVVLLYAYKADAGASDPENNNYAHSFNLEQKLVGYLDPSSTYIVDIIRQSGNVERSIGPISHGQVSSQISATMNRAKIDTVSISQSVNQIQLMRTMHNGRGRQEGKRIAGFIVRRV